MTRAESTQHISRLRKLHRLQLACFDSCEDLYHAYLAAGCEELGLSLGIVSRIHDGSYEVKAGISSEGPVHPGKRPNPNDTWCARVFETGRTIAFHHREANRDRHTHPLRISTDLESYIGAPIRVRDEIFGTLNFSDSEPRAAPFAEEEIEFLELMAAVLGRTMERDLLENQRRDAIRRMEENAALFEGAFTHAAIGMALVGTDGRWLRVNDATCDIVGYHASELRHIDFQTITHPDDLDSDLELLQETLDGKRDTYQIKKRFIHRDGSYVWILLSVSVVRETDGTARFFISQLQDITAQVNAENALRVRQRQLEAANQQLDALARTDALTGLANRREFMQRLNEEIQRSQRSGRPMAVILMDVDHFKAYNDTFGHPEGDEVLKTLADGLRCNARDTDLVARHGGEEFALLLPDTDTNQAMEVAERIRGWTLEVNSLRQPVSVSLGVNEYRPSGDEPGNEPEQLIETLLYTTDEALYEAKRAGRNKVRRPRRQNHAAT